MKRTYMDAEAANEQREARDPVDELPIPLRVRIALPRMTLANVQRLMPGLILLSDCPAAQEVPLLAAGAELSWCEFAVVDGTLAARITRLA